MQFLESITFKYRFLQSFPLQSGSFSTLQRLPVTTRVYKPNVSCYLWSVFPPRDEVLLFRSSCSALSQFSFSFRVVPHLHDGTCVHVLLEWIRLCCQGWIWIFFPYLAKCACWHLILCLAEHFNTLMLGRGDWEIWPQSFTMWPLWLNRAFCQMFE